jgi:hypothetical protein
VKGEKATDEKGKRGKGEKRKRGIPSQSTCTVFSIFPQFEKNICFYDKFTIVQGK